MSRLVPDVILHTWVEVYYNSKWITLEGVILDKPYIEGCKKKGIAPSKGSYKGYAIGVNDVNDFKVEWKGENTYIQSAGVVEDLGIFDSPDDCYKLYSQKIGAVKSWIYRSFLSKLMNSRVRKIRG